MARIKQMSLAIDEEARTQGELVKSLEAALERASAGMGRAARRLNVAYRQAKSNHLLYLALFAMALFTLVYFLAKAVRVGKAIL